MKILYKLASRSRPHKLFLVLDNMHSMMMHDDYEIQVTADIDDDSMNTREVSERIHTYPNTHILLGTSGSKIIATNRDMPLFKDWDILITMSDDMLFIQHGFDLTIINDFNSFRSLDLLLHYPDQKAWFAMCTMAIMGREYYNRDGYIYNPVYKSLFCDNEQMEVAKMRGRYKYIKKRLFNHNNPMHGLAEKDALHLKTLADFKEDKATFELRKSINFGL